MQGTATVSEPTAFPDAAGPATPPAGAPAVSLTPEQLQVLQAAQRDRRKISRAAGVAAFSGWTLATFACLTILGGIFSLPAFILGVGMAVVAWVELRGSRAMRRLDLVAPRRLGLNQLALGAMMFLYGSWGIYGALTAPSKYAEHIAAGGEMAAMLEPIDALHKTAALVLYVGVIVGAGLTTGLTAIYYFTRRSHIVAYLTRTPAWVVEALRTVH